MKQNIKGYGLTLALVTPALLLLARQVLGEVTPEWQMVVDGLAGVLATFISFRLLPLLDALWTILDNKIRKKAGLVILPLLLAAGGVAEASDNAVVIISRQVGTSTINVDGVIEVVPLEEPELFIDFSGSINAFVIDLDTRKYQIGAIPGIGYGLKWSPAFWTLSDVFLAFDLFLSAGIVEVPELELDGLDYFDVQVLPALTFANLFTIGFGGSFGVALHKDQPNRTAKVLTIGIGTAL